MGGQCHQSKRIGEEKSQLINLKKMNRSFQCQKEVNKGNNKITELRAILQSESQNS